MEFWGIELKGDKPVKVVPEDSQVVHLSQAALADLKKGGDSVTIYAKIGGQKLAIGILNADKYPQLSFDLVFEKEVELSHNSKNGNVHLTGYKSLIQDEEDEDFSDYDEEEMAAALGGRQNGLVAAPAAAKAKPAAAPAAKKDSKPKEESSDDDDEDDSDDDSDEDGSADDDSDDEVMADGDDSDDSEEEEETPVKSAGGKKRPNSATKTPEAKKAKIVTPQKSDGKKSVGGHVATPHPAKNAKSPKSGGAAAAATCGPCKKTFNSQGALDSHTKAKHSAK